MINNQYKSPVSKSSLFPNLLADSSAQNLSQEDLKKVVGGVCIVLPGCVPFPYHFPEKLTPDLLTLGN